MKHLRSNELIANLRSRARADTHAHTPALFLFVSSLNAFFRLAHHHAAVSYKGGGDSVDDFNVDLIMR